MQILRIPRSLAGALLLLSVAPVAGALHVLIADPRPWWRIPIFDLGMGALWVAALIFPLGAAFLRGRFMVRSTLIPLAAVWISAAFFQSILQRNAMLAFFSVGLLIYALAAIQWLWTESDRSYFNPKLQWYEGPPGKISTLDCKILIDDQNAQSVAASATPARLDRDGVFLFASLEAELWARITGVELSFEGNTVRVPALSTTTVGRERAHGFGLRFADVSPDTQKDLGDFLERLRVHGYAG